MGSLKHLPHEMWRPWAIHCQMFQSQCCLLTCCMVFKMPVGILGQAPQNFIERDLRPRTLEIFLASYERIADDFCVP